MKSIKQYFKFHFSFKGRLNRKAYTVILIKQILFILLYSFAFALFFTVGRVFLASINLGKIPPLVAILVVIVGLIMQIILFLIGIAIFISQTSCINKRLNDLNFSSYWHSLFAWVATVNLGLFLYLFLGLIIAIIGATAIQGTIGIIGVPKLFLVISTVSAIFFVTAFSCIKGTKGDNKYGPDPLQDGNIFIPRLSKSILLLIISPAIITLVTLPLLYYASPTLMLKKIQEEERKFIQERQRDKKSKVKLEEGVMKGEGPGQETTASEHWIQSVMLKKIQEEERKFIQERQRDKKSKVKLEEGVMKGEGPGQETTASEHWIQSVSFVRMESGSFKMGSPSTEIGRYTKTDGSSKEDQVQVEISRPFEIMEKELTQRQWFLVTKKNLSTFKESEHCDDHEVVEGIKMCPNHPVEMVSWDEVQDYIEKLNASLGLTGCKRRPGDSSGCYRLPTEAEWEYAARGGKNTVYTTYSFGDDFSDFGNYGWYGVNSGGRTHEVGTRRANPKGLYDIHGNVREWVQDRYNRLRGGRDPLNDSGAGRVHRGGSWINHYADDLRSASRGFDHPISKNSRIGFRLVRTL